MSTTHETYHDGGGRIVRALGIAFATLAAFAFGGGLVRYGLSEVWASAHQRQVLEWVRYSFTDGHDAAGVARYWSMLAASSYPFYPRRARLRVGDARRHDARGGARPCAGAGGDGAAGDERDRRRRGAGRRAAARSHAYGAGLDRTGSGARRWAARPLRRAGGGRARAWCAARGRACGARMQGSSRGRRARRIVRARCCSVASRLPRAAETRHAVVLGATGTGKSVAIREVLAGLIARGDRAVVADPDGSAMAAFWQDGDVLLNPEDARSVRWDVFGELERDARHQALRRGADAVARRRGEPEMGRGRGGQCLRRPCGRSTAKGWAARPTSR